MLEYILVGETDEGICGHPWRTWGFEGARPRSSESGSGSRSSGDDDGDEQEEEEDGARARERRVTDRAQTAGHGGKAGLGAAAASVAGVEACCWRRMLRMGGRELSCRS